MKIGSTDMNNLLTIFVLTAFIPVGKPMLNFFRCIKINSAKFYSNGIT